MWLSLFPSKNEFKVTLSINKRYGRMKKCLLEDEETNSYLSQAHKNIYILIG